MNMKHIENMVGIVKHSMKEDYHNINTNICL